MKKYCLFLVFFLFVSSFRSISAQTPTPEISPSDSEASDLQNKINDLQSKISALQGEERTLSSQISVMDNQVNLTELRIASAKKQISDLSLDIDTSTKKISKVENSLNEITKILMNRISATYMAGSASSFQVLLSSADISDFIKKANYLRIAQAHDKKLIYDTVQARNDYANQKDIFEDKKTKTEQLQVELTAFSEQLEKEKQAKNELLAQTQGNEATYQRLLSEAQAQLSGFSLFATTQGGKSILPPQDSPDGWYFNQRDERWGNSSIGISAEPVWKYGCLLSSVAMVLRQRGEDVTPSSIAASSSYYFSDTAYMLIPWAGRFTSVWQNNSGAIDSLLSSGKPVIIGLNAGAYGTHFVVLKSGAAGNYIMNDPWYGPNLEFSSHYSTGQIFQYGYLN